MMWCVRYDNSTDSLALCRFKTTRTRSPSSLEFMAFLCERESDEWEHQSEAARQLRRQERAFLDDHLARWYPEFCWRITGQRKGIVLRYVGSTNRHVAKTGVRSGICRGKDRK